MDNNFASPLSDLLSLHGGNALMASSILPAGGGSAPQCLADLLKAHCNWAAMGLSVARLDSACLDDLFEAAANDGKLRFLALTGLENLAPEAQRNVADDLFGWASLSQQSQMKSPTPSGLRLLILATPDFPSVRTNLFLSVHLWWAKTRDVDRLAGFNELALNENLDESPLVDSWWLQSLCQGFCHDDFTLMRIMLRDKPKTLEEIVETLKTHPLHDAGLRCKPKVAKAPAQAPQILGTKPRVPKDGLYRELWAKGLLFTDPHLSLHPVLMDQDQLIQAIGQGQRQVPLPLVDHMLSLLIETIEEIFGEGVWIDKEPDKEKRKSLISEISPLPSSSSANYSLPAASPRFYGRRPVISPSPGARFATTCPTTRCSPTSASSPLAATTPNATIRWSASINRAGVSAPGSAVRPRPSSLGRPLFSPRRIPPRHEGAMTGLRLR